MVITLNGEERTIPPSTALADLLLQLTVVPKWVAVEVNERLIPRGDHATYQLCAGDRIEIVTLVGGG
ncbi:MAG TPA: sulfur carrier protein ThiS [Pirellulaceae bacterium]